METSLSNISQFAVRTTEKEIIIHDTLKMKSLLINRSNFSVKEESIQIQLMPTSQLYSYFLGFSEELNSLIFCEYCQLIAKFSKEQIFKVKTLMVKLRKTKIHGKIHLKKQNEDQFILKLLESEIFYFSIEGQIDLNLQSQFYQNTEISDQFKWNCKLHEFLQHRQVSSSWFLPIMMGSVQVVNHKINNKDLVVIILSRMSWKQTSLDQLALNDDGFSSRFIETEIIIDSGNYVISHVLLRSTIPLKYNQNGLISRSQIMNTNAFQKHYQMLQKQWGQITTLSILSTKYEKEVSDMLNQLHQRNIQATTIQNFINIYPEKITKQQTYLDQVLNDLQTNLYSQGFFCMDVLSNSPMMIQKGSFYTCSSDALENLLIIKYSLNCIQMPLSTEYDDNPLKSPEEDLFYKKILLAWSRTQIILNQIYQGQMGGIKNVFSTGQIFIKMIEQNVIDALIEGINNQECHFNQYIEKRIEEYIDKSKLKLYVLTWNVAGTPPNVDTIFKFTEPPDIVVIGLQEIVELKAQNVVLFQTTQLAELWCNAFLLELKKYGQYVRIEQQNLVGIYIVVFVHASILNRVKYVESDIVKTGFSGTLGNKGAGLIRFSVDDSIFVFCNCHLSAGSKEINDRINDFEAIHNKAFQKDNQQSISNADFKLIFGDLNIRLESSYENIISLIQQIDKAETKIQRETYLQQLLTYDQGPICRNSSHIFAQYKEAPIEFLPTYKFDKNSNVYTAKNKRVPSYCDRILCANSAKCDFEVTEYDCLDKSQSDHKPVYACIDVYAHKINQKKLELIKKEYQQQLIQDGSDQESLNGQ